MSRTQSSNDGVSLNKCSRRNVFSKTIANLKLPYDYGIISITEKSKLRTKRFVLNENKKALRKVIAIKQQQLNERITSRFSPQTASQIRSQRYLAYNIASNLHRKKFLKLLDNLKNLKNNSTSHYTSDDDSHIPVNTAPNNNGDTCNTYSPKPSKEASSIYTASNCDNNGETSNTYKTVNELVTDLTHNLNTQEINLLCKGPKFNLSPGVSEHTITSINIAFYRLANQI